MSKVSIALCTYNGEKYLKEQLDSYLKQTRLPDELVVCDDGSSDLTIEILKSFGERAPFPVIIFENERNLGVVKNFEKAINECNGDIILLSDQDDIWDSRKIEILSGTLDDSPHLALAFTDVEFVNADLSPIPDSLFDILGFDETKQQSFNRDDDFNQILRINYVLGCALAVRSEHRPLICPIPTDIPKVIHDYWIGLVLCGTSRAVAVPYKLTKYRQHLEQLTGYKQVLADRASQVKEKYSRLAKHDFLGARENLLDLRSVAQRVQVAIETRAGKPSNKVAAVVNDLASNIQHLESRHRIQVSDSVVSKASIAAKELMGFRYHRYSNGLRSFTKDLFLSNT